MPPKGNRLEPWEYSKEIYEKRNEVERLFRRLIGFRRIFSRFDKLDVMFTAFIYIALIFDAISGNTTQYILRSLNEVHKSYVVALKHLEVIESLLIRIGDIKIPVGRNFREELM